MMGYFKRCLRWQTLVFFLPLVSSCNILIAPEVKTSCEIFANAYQKLSSQLISSDVFYDKSLLVAQWSAMQCARDQWLVLADAEQAKWDYIDQRAKRFPVAGYKVALGSAGAQALFGLPAPVVGALFSDTLINNGATIYRSAGVNLAYEPDLIAVVKSADINSATTIEEVAPHIEKLVAFLEVPDLLTRFEPAAGLTFTASNAAVRWGVLGDSIIARGDQTFVDSLVSMRVSVVDGQGNQLSKASGDALMGHPYNAIVFLLDNLRKNNRRLNAGDSISLGAFARPIALKTMPLASYARQNIVTVNYSGIDGEADFSVTATFVD